jgi:glycosyltransferase involved in cell wall biosynthesis
MRIGIELRHIIPESCGGIVPLLTGVLETLFAISSENRFDIYCIQANTRLFPAVPANVNVDVLPEENYFRDLDALAVMRGTDVLFRSYPLDSHLDFPTSRQIGLIPDIQHDYLPELFDPITLQRRRECFKKALNEWAAIGTISQHARETILAHPETRTTDIFLMPPALVEATNPILTLEEQKAIPTTPYLLFPANLWPHKNHRRLLDAFRLYLARSSRPVELLLTGHPEGWEALAVEAAGLPVRHLGYVSRPLLSALMGRARALVYFSLYEGFGMPLLEAFRLGIPVLCSNTTSLPEVGEDAIVTCDPTDTQAMADAMYRVLSEPALRARMILAGARRLSHFSWRSSAQSLLDACRRVAVRHTPPTFTQRVVRAARHPNSILMPAVRRRVKRILPSSVHRILRALLRPGEVLIPACRRRLDVWKTNLKRKLLTPAMPYHRQHPPQPIALPWSLPRLLPQPTPTISIVTPSYNHVQFLERTIRSVLDQRYPALEYVVQDGGSTDGTSKILEHYKDRLKHCESRRDAGQTNAINLGFRHTTGQIMAYLNSDDLLLPGSLARVARYFQTHPDVDAVYSHRIIIDEDDQEVGRWVLPPHDGEVMCWVDFIPQETLFWRRRLWDRVGGTLDESFQFAMDWELLLRFHHAGARIVRLPCYLGAFRSHAQQKTSARMQDLGSREIARLRERTIGRPITEEEAWQVAMPYVKRHAWFHLLDRIGIRY